MTLYMDNTGPLIVYENGLLEVEDLNPHVKTKWRMSRYEMVVTGLRFLLAAIKG